MSSGFSGVEFQRRRDRLLAQMEVAHLDVLLIYAAKPESGYVRYYTGWESELGIFDCSLLVVSSDQRTCWTLLTNAFWHEESPEAGLQATVVTANLPEAIKDFLSPNTKRIGIAPFRQLPADIYRSVVEYCPDAEFRDAKNLLLQLRTIKSEAEIDILRKVAAIADAGARAFSEAIRPEVSEQDVAAEVEYALRRSGSGSLIFSTLLSSGERTSEFIAMPTSKRLSAGEIVQLDCGPSLFGYHGDLSRCATVGEPPPSARRLLEDTVTLYEECFRVLRPQERACDVATAVLAVAKSLGYGSENLYQSPNVKPGFVGHGIGLANPDMPQLSTADASILESGMVINIEVILRTAGGSARLEDAVVIEPHGATRLCESPIRLWDVA